MERIGEGGQHLLKQLADGQVIKDRRKSATPWDQTLHFDEAHAEKAVELMEKLGSDTPLVELCTDVKEALPEKCTRCENEPEASISTMHKMLKGQLITLKRIQRALAERNTDETKKLRSECAQWYCQEGSQNLLIFTDECPFHWWLTSNRARSKKGTPATVGNMLNKGPNHSLFLAINEEMGIVHYDIKMKTSAEVYDEWLDLAAERVEKFIEEKDDKQKMMFAMDNASIHKKDVKKREDVKYLPPYSPFLNPIEYIFGIIKAEVKKVLRQWMQASVVNITDRRKFSGFEKSELLRTAIKRGIAHSIQQKGMIGRTTKHIMQYIPDCMALKPIEGPPELHLREIDRVLGATIQEVTEAARAGTDLSEIAGPEDGEMQKEECIVCNEVKGALCARCDTCKKYVHAECNEQLVKFKKKEIEAMEANYACPKCRAEKKK